MGIDKVCFNVTLHESVATAPLHLRGDPTQDEVVLTPVVASPLTHFNVVVGSSPAQQLPIESALALVGATWLPWEGAPARDAPAAVQAGHGARRALQLA